MGPRTDRRMAQGRQRAWPAGLGVRGHLRLHLSRRPQGRGPLALSDAPPQTPSSAPITAFAQHGLLQSMRAMATWFCDAYASWQKGGVENANGRLRRWLPRHIDIDRLSDAEIQDIVITANLTPRKCLGFKTPFQAILKE